MLPEFAEHRYSAQHIKFDPLHLSLSDQIRAGVIAKTKQPIKRPRNSILTSPKEQW